MIPTLHGTNFGFSPLFSVKNSVLPRKRSPAIKTEKNKHAIHRPKSYINAIKKGILEFRY